MWLCSENSASINIITARCYAERGYATVCRLSVRPSVCLSICPSVTFRYRDHLSWNTSKTISWPNSLRHLLRATENTGLENDRLNTDNDNIRTTSWKAISTQHVRVPLTSAEYNGRLDSMADICVVYTNDICAVRIRNATSKTLLVLKHAYDSGSYSIQHFLRAISHSLGATHGSIRRRVQCQWCWGRRRPPPASATTTTTDATRWKYGCPEKFRESLATPTATFPENANGLLLW